jgi:O-antigen/teichoic acid export membrane protein
MAQRIARVSSALAAGHAVYIVAQLVLPPAFITSYGITGYGEWLALSAGVGWIQTLDCGFQSYLVNELSIQFQRGNLSRVRQLQSVALRISLGILALGLLMTLGVLALEPVNVMLRLSMTRASASLIVVLLSTEILLGIVWGQMNGMIRSFGYPHRAEAWAQTYSFITTAATIGLVLNRVPLWMIPAARVSVFFVMMAVSLVDLRRLAPELVPQLSYWDRTTAREIVRPSLWFGSFTVNQFLLFQAPVLILNSVAGKSAVVAFSICRSFYGVIRQLAQVARASVSPELTRLAGSNDLTRLRRLFTVYENLSLFVGFVGPVVAFIAAPKIVPVWTHTGAISVPLFAAMMVTSALNVAKDTRLALLQATNHHIRAARMCLIMYAGFAVGCIPVAIRWGATGIVALWMGAEILQLIFAHFESQTVLPALGWRAPGALFFASVAVLMPAWWLAQIVAISSWFLAGSLVTITLALLALAGASLFGLSSLPIGRGLVQPKVPSESF